MNRKLTTLAVMAFSALSLSSLTRAADIAKWDFTGEVSVVTSTAEVVDAGINSPVVLTRGSGAAASTGNNSFRTVGFQNNGIAVTNTDYFQTTITPSAGSTLSLSTIDATMAGTATYSNSPGVSNQFAYSLDGVNFTLIGSPVIRIGNGALTQVNLSGISALQNVTSSNTITLRFYASGQTATGGWGFNSPSLGSYGLVIGGTVTTGDTTPPTLASTSPADNDSGVSTTTNLVATFDETVQKGTSGNVTIKKTSDNSIVDTINITTAAVSVAGAVVTIDPTVTLAFNTEYYVTIDAGAFKDTATIPNNYAGLSSTTAWSFTTLVSPDTTPPTVASTNPADNATNVSTTANLVATFSETVQKGDSGNVFIKKTSDDSTVDTIDITTTAVTVAGDTVTIDPNVTLDASTEYYVTIDANAFKDNATIPNNFAGLSSTTDWSFTTSDAPSLFISQYYEGTSFNKFIEIYNNGVANIDLSEYSLTLWSNSNAEAWKTGGTATATLPLSGTLAPGEYYLFSHADATTPGYAVPANVTDSSVINFNGNDSVVLYRSAVVVDAVSFTSGNEGVDKSFYRLNYNVGFNTTSGSSVTTFPSVWGVKTNAEVDGATNTDLWYLQKKGISVPPTLVSTSPADNDIDVSPSTNLVATFSETMQKGAAGNVTIKKTSDDSIVDTIDITTAAVTVVGDTVTIDPTVTLDFNTEYYVIIDAAAFKDNDAIPNDYAGLSSTTAWSFTTLVSADTTPPALASTNPADNDINVSTTANLVATFDETVQKGDSGNVYIKKTSDDSTVDTIDIITPAVTVAGAEVTIVPNITLDFSTEYYVTIDANAFKDNATVPNNYAGLSSTTAWSFTTADEPPPVGAPLATWNFTGAAGNQATQPAESTVSGITAADVSRGAGITASAAGDSISSSGWATGGLDTDDYYEFAITINPAITANLTSIAFAERRSGTGIGAFALRSSLDDFTNDIATINVPDDTATRNQSINLPGSFAALTNTTVTFRLYGYTAEAGTGTWRIANHTDFGGLVINGFSGPSDPNAPPVLFSFSPTGSGQSTAPTLSLTFSKDVTAGPGDVVIYNASDDSVAQPLPASSATISGATATFNVTGLSAASSYYVLVDADAFEDNLNQFYAGLADTGTWTFATVDPTPTVVSLVPAHENAEVLGNGVIFVIEYDRAVNVGSGIIEVVDAFNPSNVAATFDVTNASEVSVSGDLLTTLVPIDLDGDVTYAVNVPAGVVVSDDAAAAPSAAISGFDWIFITVLPDETPPVVDTLSPANGDGGAPISSTLQVTFDEDVVLGDGPWTIEVVDLTFNTTGFTYTEADITNVAAAGSTLTITPPAPFTELTDYVVTLSSGVVKDLAGNASTAIGGVGLWEFTTAGPFVAGNVVISQVYGGGGNAGATLTHDFVELHNKSSETAYITGWSVQYASSAGSSWSVTPLTGSIAPGGYYLVQMAQGTGGTTPLPMPDAIGTSAMAAGSGKVALVGNSTALTGSDPLSDPLLQISDFVGYGAANASEGGVPTAVIGSTLSAIRLVNGSVDTNNNGADFVTGAPAPRNSSSPPFSPGVDGGGIASAKNAGGSAGTLSNLPLFASAESGQTLAVTVTGTTVDMLTTVVVEVPSDFSAPLIGNVSLSGSASGGASAMVSGQTITVSNAAVTNANSLTVTISGLTAPDATAVLSDTGNRTVGVLTAATGGTPTSIVSPPIVTAVVPVTTLAALRAEPTDGTKTYLVDTEVVVTYATPTFRNQHWVQDSTAGIVIDDQPLILTSFVEGSGITGLVGKLVLFNGLLELQPSYNAGALTSTGDTPEPLVVSLADLIADPIAYQARLVRVNDVVFTSLPGTFAGGSEHPIALAADELVTFNLRSFSNTNYDGTALPAIEVDLVGLIQTRNVTEDSFISPRKLADIITGVPPVDPGDPLATWDFTGATGNQVSQAVNTTATGISASDVTRGTGLTAETGTNSINSSGWSTGAIDADDFYEFTVTVDASISATLKTIAFAERRSGSGIQNFALRSSRDGFAADIATFNVAVDDTSVRQRTITLPESFADLADTVVTFRLYGYNAVAGSGTWRIANNTEFGGLVVLGTTEPVVVPGGYGTWADLYAGGGAVGDDFNNDGVDNGLAYFFGAEDGFVPTPGIVNGSITFPRDSSLTDVSFVVQTSDDLEDWDDVLVEDLDLSDPDFITYVLPGAPAPFFVRIKVTVDQPLN